MHEKYTSERLLRELPRPLLNFIWYLWETYYDPSEPEFRVTLQDNDETGGQRIFVHAAGVTVNQTFGCSINTEIVIRKCGTRYFMEYA